MPEGPPSIYAGGTATATFSQVADAITSLAEVMRDLMERVAALEGAAVDDRPKPPLEFTEQEAAALRTIIAQWVDEGFVGGHFAPVHYNLFEKLDLASEFGDDDEYEPQYDIRRPA
jgi:hypothetical protein